MFVIMRFVISGFCSIHFTVTLASGDLAIKGFVYRDSTAVDCMIGNS